jgi:arylsulfatase A-like enzyme
MQVSSFLRTTILSTLIFVASSIFAQQKPNVLFIMTDELSAETMSLNLGSKFIKTPNIDYLATHGVRFTNAYCANPLCVPSRSSIFTGRYPHELGIQNNDDTLIDPVTFPSMGTIFKNAGYETGYIGKWHLPYDRNKDDTHGFTYMSNKKGNGTDSLLPNYAKYFFELKREKPFLLVMSFLNPHNICQWARGEELPDGEIGNPTSIDQLPPLRANALPSKNETEFMTMMRKSIQENPVFPVGNFSDQKWREYIWSYYRLVEKVDAEIGKVLNLMRQKGLDKNTLIVFTSDHGDLQGAHRWNQKTVFYEEASKVPFIMSFNNGKQLNTDVLVQSGIDILPTICDFAGITTPISATGKSLAKAFTAIQQLPNRDFVVVADKLSQGAPVNGVKINPEGRMLRNKQFKYWIYNHESKSEVLYDIVNDPGEMINLIDDPNYTSALKNCRAQLLSWAKENKDPFIKFLVK